MPLKVKFTDLLGFDTIPHPQTVKPSVQTPAQLPLTLHNDKAGTLQFSNLVLPYMHIMSLNWETGNEDMILYDDSAPLESININFQVAGNMFTTFRGLHHNLDMKSGTHNLVYIPEDGDTHKIHRKQTLSLVHVSLDKDFFLSSIGQDDKWGNDATETISRKKPFSGITGTLDINARMQQLIKSVYHCEEVGPMRNMLIQSRTLELIALQISQFTSSTQEENNIKTADTDKLHNIKLYIDQHFLSDLSLTGLAQVSLLNEFKLKQGFKKLFGTTVFSYIRELRMNYARTMLTDTLASIDEVADAIGYEHTQHFSIAFKKHFGYNPSELRKKSRSA